VVFTLGSKRIAQYPLRRGEPATKYIPTNVAVAPTDIYVADGYGSSFINQATQPESSSEPLAARVPRPASSTARTA
jgi:hypothetical protein